MKEYKNYIEEAKKESIVSTNNESEFVQSKDNKTEESRLIAKNKLLVSQIFEKAEAYKTVIPEEFLKKIFIVVNKYRNYEYVDYELKDFDEILEFFSIFKYLPQAYEFEIKPYNGSVKKSVQLLESDSFGMNGIIISFDQIKNLIDEVYSNEERQEILKDFKIRFGKYVENMTRENKKAMSEELKEYLSKKYTICNLILENISAENKKNNKKKGTLKDNNYNLQLDLSKEERSLGMIDDLDDEYKNMKYYINLKGEECKSKIEFNPFEENRELLIVHYSKENNTDEQNIILSDFFNSFLLPIIKRKFENNELAQKIDIVSFSESLFKNILEGTYSSIVDIKSEDLKESLRKENITLPDLLALKLISAYKEYINYKKKRAEQEKADNLNHLKSYNVELLDLFADLTALITSYQQQNTQYQIDDGKKKK